MKAIESSLSHRAARRAATGIGAAARCSLVGRFFIALARIGGRVFADSGVFGLQRSGSRRLEWSGHPWSVLVISRPYLWLRAAVAGAAPPRTVGRAGSDGSTTGAGRTRAGWVRSAWFGGGAWVLIVGAGIFTLGCGRLSLLIARGTATFGDTGLALVAPELRLVTPVILMVMGALAFTAGPRLLPAARTGLVGRAARWFGLAVVEGRVVARAEAAPRAGVLNSADAGGVGGLPPLVHWRRLGSPLGAGVALAAIAGLLGGLTYGSGPIVLVALVAALCALVLVLWRPEVMLLAVAAFPWLDWAARRSLGSFGPAWDDAFLILSIVVLLWCVIVLRRSELWTVPILLPVLLALAAAIGSVVVRDVPGDVALFALRVLFQPLLFYFLGFLFPKNKRWVQWVVAVFLLAGVALALHGLYQYVSHAPMPARWVDVREVEDIQTRAYSIVENPNGLGAFLLLGALLSLSLALTRGLRRLQRWVMAVACVIQLAGVAVTFSRGAWLGLAAGIVALIVVAHRRYLAPLVAAGVLAWFVLPQKFINRLTFAFSSAYIAKSLAAGRLYVWKISLQHIAAHPLFGLGLGTFGGTSAATFGFSRLWVDNFYLQLGAEGGLLLLALFLWVLLRGAKGLIKSHGMTSDPFLRALTAGVFGGCVAVAVANVTASVWETLVVGVGFWFLAGLATSAVLRGAYAEATEDSGAAEGDAAEEAGT